MNIKVIYNRRKKLDANGCALITLSITHEKKRVFKPTGIRVKPNQFNESTQKVINHPQAAKMNAAIAQTIATYQRREVDLLAKMRPYTVSDIVDHTDTNVPTFIEFARKEAQERSACNKSKYLYSQVIDNLYEFAHGDFVFERINLKFLRDFDKYLVAKDLHQNTIAKRHQVFKMFINAAIRDGYMQVHENPYTRFNVKRLPTVRKALESEQLAALEVLDVPDAAKPVKDMFLFSCYTGLRYSDMIRVSKTDIVRSGDGVYLNMREQKTKKLKQNLPLHKLFGGKAVAIIDKYESKYKDFIFPTYTDQHINRMLKIVGVMLHLDFPLTFHCSRHTFGTMLAEKTQDPYLIKELMNHSDLKTSMIYIHSSKTRIENALSKVDWSLE